jgi:hypothetical protein
MNIELGVSYKTRNGCIVKIRDIDENASHPFFGDILDNEGKHVRVASFSYAGNYASNMQENQFDIVEKA